MIISNVPERWIFLWYLLQSTTAFLPFVANWEMLSP
nr:MAG TPA_asm: hypothetical protein [Caudoviricetes sp.]